MESFSETNGLPINGGHSEHHDAVVHESQEVHAERSAEEAFFDFAQDEVWRMIDNLDLPFHNWEHTQNVIERVELILEKYKEHGLVPDTDIQRAKIAALFHDVAQNYERRNLAPDQIKDQGFVEVDGPLDFEVEVLERTHFSGLNEFVSSELLARFIDDYNNAIAQSQEVVGSGLSPHTTEKMQSDVRTAVNEFNERIQEWSHKQAISQSDVHSMKKPILSTEPKFTEEGAVVQPAFTENASPISQALMLADLGTVGMNTNMVEGAIETKKLFWERHIGLRDALRNHLPLTETEKEYYYHAMLNTLKQQEHFIQSQKEQFDEHVRLLPPEVQPAIRALFSHYDQNAHFAHQEYEIAKGKKDFDALREHMELNTVIEG